MKKILMLFGLLPILTACDAVDEADRYIDTGPVEVARKVLLEEFTGQYCTNCPDAHQRIERLEEQYGDDLIVVSIHAGNFGLSSAYGGLMQEEGNIYADHWGISAYPAGVVDRNSGVENMTQWAATIKDDIEIETDLQLSLQAQLSEDGKEIEVFTTMVASENLTGSLQLWVVENGIIGFQIYGRDRLQDYEHNNVFRACVNGVWGESLPLEKGIVKYVSNTVAINEEWNLDNIRIVGFYYNNSGVVQVDRCSLE